MATAVVIPAFKPDESLLDLLRALRERTFIDSLVVVDDGSGPQYESIFAQAAQLCTLKRHAQNRGKGAAIRTGLEALGGAFNVVTADCDGQHTPSDIEKIARAIDGALVLGVRRKREMPLRSKMGNTLTCLTFALVSHRWISDTQTGLRGIPQSFLEVCRQLEGDRYEYEMHMLLEACRRLREEGEADFDGVSEQLFRWAQKLLTEESPAPEQGKSDGNLTGGGQPWRNI